MPTKIINSHYSAKPVPQSYTVLIVAFLSQRRTILGLSTNLYLTIYKKASQRAIIILGNQLTLQHLRLTLMRRRYHYNLCSPCLNYIHLLLQFFNETISLSYISAIPIYSSFHSTAKNETNHLFMTCTKCNGNYLIVAENMLLNPFIIGILIKCNLQTCDKSSCCTIQEYPEIMILSMYFKEYVQSWRQGQDDSQIVLRIIL